MNKYWIIIYKAYFLHEKSFELGLQLGLGLGVGVTLTLTLTLL